MYVYDACMQALYRAYLCRPMYVGHMYVHVRMQCRIYSVADVAYATGPALLGAPRFSLDFFTRVKQIKLFFYLHMINHLNMIIFLQTKSHL